MTKLSLVPRLPASFAERLQLPDRQMELYGPALALMIDGCSMAQAARESGCRYGSLVQFIAANPRVKEAIDQHNASLESLILLDTNNAIAERLSDEEARKKLSTRDLTDLHRSYKPKAEESKAEINIVSKYIVVNT